MGEQLSLGVAFSAGLLSFFSPCILPLIPTYLTFLLGDYAEQKENEGDYTLIPPILFIVSFSLVFILLGLSASYVGQLFLAHQQILQQISGFLVIVLGLHLSGFISLSFLSKTKMISLPEGGNKYFRSLIMGFGLAFAWTPCIGPILASILMYAGTEAELLTGGLMLFLYSLGMAIPFLLTAIFARQLLPKFKKLHSYLPIFNRLAGILIIIIGILIFTDNFTVLIPV